MFQKLIVGIFALVLFSELTYQFGLLITAMFIGDYSKAQNIVNGYGFIYKILLTILTGGLIGTFFAISTIFYRIGVSIFKKDN